MGAVESRLLIATLPLGLKSNGGDGSISRFLCAHHVRPAKHCRRKFKVCRIGRTCISYFQGHASIFFVKGPGMPMGHLAVIVGNWRSSALDLGACI